MAFDFTKFTIDAIRSIDEIRALNATPQNTGSPVEKTESRINAFYRALGLPAFGQIYNYNNGNLFDTELPNNTLAKLDARNILFSANIPEDTVQGLLDYNKFHVDDGLLGLRTRGILLPMMVNGNIHVFPQQNRVGGAFNALDDDLVIDDVQYKRPLIELITLLRLRNDGVSDNTIEQNVVNDFSSLDVGDDFFSGANFNALTAQIIVNLLKVVQTLPKFINKTVKEINSIRAEVRNNFKPVIANLPSAQPIESSSFNDGATDRIKALQQETSDQNNALFALLSFDDTITSGQEITKNAKNAILANSVINMIGFSESDEIKELQNTLDKEKKLLSRLKVLQQKVDTILGIYSGISGIDILLVITALFLINQEDLLGLLNAEALDRLSALKGGTSFTPVSNVFDSISALEAKTSDLFKIVIQKL